MTRGRGCHDCEREARVAAAVSWRASRQLCYDDGSCHAQIETNCALPSLRRAPAHLRDAARTTRVQSRRGHKSTPSRAVPLRFRQNVGLGRSEGTVSMALSDATLLRIENSVFDSNVARLGSGFLIAAVSQVSQLSLSGVTFRNSRAYIGGVMYSESLGYGDLVCDPHPCDWRQNNSASDYGDTLAMPPKVIDNSMPERVRSGAPLPVTVTMYDRLWAAAGKARSRGRLQPLLRLRPLRDSRYWRLREWHSSLFQWGAAGRTSKPASALVSSCQPSR